MIVLAVDNDTEHLRVLTDSLHRVFSAHAIVSFCDPLMAFPFAMNNRVDMAFLGLRMPRANVIETAGILRRFNPLVSICVMGYDVKDERMARQQGFYMFVQKPVTETCLRRVLKITMNLREFTNE